MGYKVKWVEDNLGISRKALRNYEKLGLMPPNIGGGYRDYSDEDIDRIWSIKILQGIGYSLAEISELIENPDTDFYSSISNKVVDLEKKRDEITRFIEFAKTIKLTGRVPTTKEIGSIKFSDFMDYSRKNWNFYIEPKSAKYLDVMELIRDTKEYEITDVNIERLEALADLMGDYQETQRTCTINAYYQILASMQEYDSKSETVQMVVRQMYEFLSQDESVNAIGDKFNPEFFAKYTAPFFLEGSDIGNMNIASYGKEEAEFIARAIAFFGGFKTLDDLYEA